MRYELRLTAFDMLDLVHVSVQILGPGLEGSFTSEQVAHYSTTVRGTGEPDPSLWARDALIAALEVL